MSSAVKAVSNVGKKFLGGVKKAWKSVTSSTFGKVLLIAAAIYLGGAAMGYWNSGIGGVDGALVSQTGAELGTGTVTAEGGSGLAQATSVGAEVGMDDAALASSQKAAADAAAKTALAEGGGTNAVANSFAPGSTPGTGGAPYSTPPGNSLDLSVPQYANSGAVPPVPGTGGAPYNIPPRPPAESWFSKMPGPAQYGLIAGATQVGGQALASAFSPNAMDVANRQAELERENAQWRYDFLQPNFQVGSVNTGFRPAGQPVVPGQPVPPGMISAANRR